MDIVEKEKSVAIRKEGDEDQGRNFTFDYVYGIESTQKQVYDESAYGLVESVLEGYNGRSQIVPVLFHKWHSNLILSLRKIFFEIFIAKSNSVCLTHSLS